jgi:hypothetical protein
MALGTGCVSTKNVPARKGELARFQGTNLAVTERPTPDFADFKPSNAMFGAVGGLASVGSGNDLIRENGVPDPAIEIGKRLAAHLSGSFGVLAVAETFSVQVKGSSVDEISAPFAGRAGLLLDVQTVNWSCVYLPLNWSRYRVIYSVKVRVIDVAKRKAVAEGFYVWQTPDSMENPKYDELFANQAGLLRAQLDIAAAEAVKHFAENVLVEK